MIDEAIQEMAQYPEAYRRAILEHVALGPMLAGIDTVANSLSFMLYALLAHPEALQRVQAEVDAAWGSGTLSWEQFKQMPDLQGRCWRPCGAIRSQAAIEHVSPGR